MSEPFNLTWRQWIIYVLLAAFGATAAKLFDFIRGRSVDKATIHKTSAEANELDVKTELTAGQMLREMNRDIIKLERDKAQLKQENRVYETQLQRVNALLKLHGVTYDDDE